MDYLTQYYKNFCEQLQEKINLLEEELKNNNSLPFEILGVSAPEAYHAPHLYGAQKIDPRDMIHISGRHIKPDGSRGPEVHIPVDAFTEIHPNQIVDHAQEFLNMRGRINKISPEKNILYKVWNDQGGNTPSTLQVDPSKIQSLESYSKRIQQMGL